MKSAGSSELVMQRGNPSSSVSFFLATPMFYTRGVASDNAIYVSNPSDVFKHDHREASARRTTEKRHICQQNFIFLD